MSARASLGGFLGLVLGLCGGASQARAPTAAFAPHVLAAVAAPDAREGVARVAVAEAGNQGDSGLLAVVWTLLNRLADGRWGTSVDQVLNARAQFEPVLKAGGDWRALPAATAVQRARIDTLLNLALAGRAPDPTGGALYFQNPSIVAARAAAGQVSPRRVHFGGRTPSAVIGDHAFYPAAGGAATVTVGSQPAPHASAIFAPSVDARTPAAPTASPRSLFVLPDGSVR